LRPNLRLIKAVGYRVLAIITASTIGYVLGLGVVQAVISAVIIETVQLILYYSWDTLWDTLGSRFEIKRFIRKRGVFKSGENSG